ncbi:hypothetical protein F183_A11870 [Bryobacterales bacterium F-183]|nr:hypothetical protein F183_A11870 [Bryobacterales bacterium F-183]
MNKQITSLCMAGLLLGAELASAASVRVNVNLGVGHPLRRVGRTVIVRRPMPVVQTRFVYAPPVRFAPAVVVMPPRDRVVFEDSETFARREDWVDNYFKVHNRGEELMFRVDGRVQIDFAEVQFGNGQVQVVDFNEAPMNAGIYRLLDFRDGRDVEGVRMVARSMQGRSTISVLMRK